MGSQIILLLCNIVILLGYGVLIIMSCSKSFSLITYFTNKNKVKKDMLIKDMTESMILDRII